MREGAPLPANENTQLEVQRTQIRAPFDGVVATRLVSPGDRVEPEDALVQIDSIDRLQVVFALSERYVAEARTGVPVPVRVVAYPGAAAFTTLHI